MSCSDACSIDMDADGHTEFYSEVVRRARKPYKCCECYEPISVGERYEAAAGKWEGEIFTERTCLPCAEIRRAFACSWVFGKLWETIRDQLFGGWNDMKAIDCLAKLTTDAAIAKMRAEYAQYVEDQS